MKSNPLSLLERNVHSLVCSVEASLDEKSHLARLWLMLRDELHHNLTRVEHELLLMRQSGETNSAVSVGLQQAVEELNRSYERARQFLGSREIIGNRS